jgi:DNA-binding NarL/FixJ family response regulator
VKTADPAELERAIRAVMAGEKFLSSAVSKHVVDAVLGRVRQEQSSLERLAPRQREVLQLVAEGHTSKEIARKLEIGVKTAEAYRADLMRALDIHDVASLTRYAVRTGLVSPEA